MAGLRSNKKYNSLGYPSYTYDVDSTSTLYYQKSDNTDYIRQAQVMNILMKTYNNLSKLPGVLYLM